MSTDEAAIREVIATWLRASKAGDTATVLGLMADDAVFLVAGQKPFGKEEFANPQTGPKRFHFEADSHVREVQVAGGWAYCWTDLTVVLTPAGGPPIKKTGNTLTIFQKQPGGRWVLFRDANTLTDEKPPEVDGEPTLGVQRALAPKA
jgi:uncharacterized protein (TIGR02246 family)